jgi:hypothetical protein
MKGVLRRAQVRTYHCTVSPQGRSLRVKWNEKERERNVQITWKREF